MPPSGKHRIVLFCSTDCKTTSPSIPHFAHAQCSGQTVYRRKLSQNFIETAQGGSVCGDSRRGSEAADMADPAAQTSAQPRLQQAQSSGSAGSNPNPGAGSSDPARPGLSQQQWSSQKKAQVRSFPRAKKLEKLGVFSSCKVTESLAHNNRASARAFHVSMPL